jgi:ABC-type glycerol-3-phosphate transport system permease component
MNGAILAAINLVGVFICAALLAHACVRLHWRRNGFALVALAVVLWGLIWLVPQAFSAFVFQESRVLDRLWFANWLMSAAGAVLLARTASVVPQQLHNRAQLDGLGAMAIFRHVVWPFAKGAIIAIAVLTLMAMSLEFLRPFLGDSSNANIFGIIAGDPRDPAALGTLAVTSVALSLPVIAIAFFATRSGTGDRALANVRT